MVRENDDFDFSYERYREYYEHNLEAGFDMFDRLPGVEFLDTGERAELFEKFNEGFVTPGGDREPFFDMMGMEVADFPWEDWLEWMGYE